MLQFRTTYPLVVRHSLSRSIAPLLFDRVTAFEVTNYPAVGRIILPLKVTSFEVTYHPVVGRIMLSFKVTYYPVVAALPSR